MVCQQGGLAEPGFNANHHTLSSRTSQKEFWFPVGTVGGRRRNPTETQGGHADTSEKPPGWDSRFEATVLTNGGA